MILFLGFYSFSCDFVSSFLWYYEFAFFFFQFSSIFFCVHVEIALFLSSRAFLMKIWWKLLYMVIQAVGLLPLPLDLSRLCLC